MNKDFNELLSSRRQGAGKKKGKKNTDPFYSDRTRILYCSAFRRLQQKAQVFSLETNSGVRSRLTHSLEVADLGRRLANEISYGLNRQGDLTEANMDVLVSVVENACLLHDIGNPPFGHFGESAIQDWAKNRALAVAPDACVDVSTGVRKWKLHTAGRMQDFLEFDGNPQGFRTVTKLYTDFGPNGLDLTYATLLCGLKYARTTGQSKERNGRELGILKKAGWFQTEDDQVRQMHAEVKRDLGTRYPLTYIMEAADDIAYCMSDIADGIEKDILTEGEFIRVFIAEWDKKWNPDYAAGRSRKRVVDLPEEIRKYHADPEKMRGFNHDFSVPWSTRATKDAVDGFLDAPTLEKILDGEAEPLMDRDCDSKKIQDIIRKVCRKVLYPSTESEHIELTGYAVITGILRHYERLLRLSKEEFDMVMDGERMKFPVETRLYNRIGSRCVDAYRNAWSEVAAKGLDPEVARQEEWWLRVHLLIDHISSMTDAFALETYQMLEGIALMRT